MKESDLQEVIEEAESQNTTRGPRVRRSVVSNPSCPPLDLTLMIISKSGDKDSAPSSGPGYNEHGANIRVQCKNGYTLAKRSDRSVTDDGTMSVNKMEEGEII